METALKVFSWIGIVLGVFAILGSLSEPVDAGYAFVGGLLFFMQGLLAVIYIKQQEE